MINKKKYFPANNCQYHVSKDGRVELLPTPHFTIVDLILVGELAIERAKKAKVRMPALTNRWWLIPTLTDVVA